MIGPAEAAAAQVEVGIGLGLRRQLGEEVVGARPTSAGSDRSRCRAIVGARLGGHVERAAAGAPGLGVVGVDLHVDVFERLDRSGSPTRGCACR